MTVDLASRPYSAPCIGQHQRSWINVDSPRCATPFWETRFAVLCSSYPLTVSCSFLDGKDFAEHVCALPWYVSLRVWEKFAVKIWNSESRVLLVLRPREEFHASGGLARTRRVLSAHLRRCRASGRNRRIVDPIGSSIIAQRLRIRRKALPHRLPCSRIVYRCVWPRG